MICNCCDAPPGPCGAEPFIPGGCVESNARIRFQWESVAASGSKCGFQGYDGQTHRRFRQRHDFSVQKFQVNKKDSAEECPGAIVESLEATRDVTDTYDADCVLHSGTIQLDSVRKFYDCGTLDETVEFHGAGAIRPCNIFVVPYLSTDVEETAESRHELRKYELADVGAESHYTLREDECTSELSNEYTTEQLESKVDGDKPAYDGDWNDTPGRYREMSEGEDALSKRWAKFRLKHPPTGTCYLKVWLRKKIMPLDGGAATYEEMDPYVWTGAGGSGGLCLPDSEKGWLHNDNQITSPEFVLDPPETNANVLVEAYKFAFVEGYEPADEDPETGAGAPSAPNGYPADE